MKKQRRGDTSALACRGTNKMATTKRGKAKKPVGRPRIELDPKQAKIFGYFRATYDTMAEQIGCHVDTIRAAMQDENSEFSKAYKNGFSSMKMKLSEAQVKTAIEEHNPTLLVWLGKQYLDQKDNPMPDEDVNKNYTVILVPKKQAESDNN
mgnify:CR=1 FL=1